MQVLQRGLPRPDNLAALPEPPNAAELQGRTGEQADALIQAELVALLQHEAVKYPVKEKKKGKRKRGETAEPAAAHGPLGAWEDIPVGSLSILQLRLGDAMLKHWLCSTLNFALPQILKSRHGRLFSCPDIRH